MFGLAACSPMSKESYLERFDEFMSEVSNNYKTYDDRAWTKQTKKYEKFSGKWYDKFKDKFTLKDQIRIKANQAKWYYCRNLGEATSTIKQLLDVVDIKGIKQKMRYYIDNDMQGDLQKLYDDVKKAGKDAKDALEEILKEMDVKIDKLQR
jgi:hypothetical protein